MPPSPEPTDPAARRLERGDVTIGIITALPHEAVAIKTFLTDTTDLSVPGDPNIYHLGYLDSSDRARPHHVAMVQMPEDNTRNAAVVCTELLRTFQGVRCVLMVGIAGGVPSLQRPERHIRLGDVVVAIEGVIDYGHVRQADGVDAIRRPLEGMCVDLLRAVNELRQQDLERRAPVWSRPVAANRPLASFSRPPASSDQLVVGGRPVEHPDPARTGHQRGRSKAHYGSIGSGDSLVRDAQWRDELAGRYGVIAMEMEAAGVAAAARQRGVPWFVVRGISDYCDGRKNDRWQNYAALMAASYTRTLLRFFRPYPAWSAAPGSGVLALVPDPERVDIIRALNQVPDLDPRALWHASAGDFAQMPEQPLRTVGEVFDHLAALNADDGMPPAIALLEEVAALATESQAGVLRWWSDTLAERLHAVAPLERRRASRPQRAADRPTDETPQAASTGPDCRTDPKSSAEPEGDATVNHGGWPCLVVQIVPDGIEHGRFLTSFWIQRRSGPWQPEPGEDEVEALRASLPAEVDRFIRLAEQEWRAHDGPIAIEFLLPTDLFNLPVEWWPRNLDTPAPTPLCADYDVVLRSLDRMHAGHSHRQWLMRWQALWRSPGAHGVLRRDGSEPDLGRWGTRLHFQEDVGAVVLSASPDSDTGREELDIALRAGIAMIIWDRRGQINADDEPAVRRLAAGHPAQLMYELRQLRKDAVMPVSESDDAHLGRHIAVLWDDATRPIDLRGAGR
jgi:nucleoside phosphorylase